MIPANAYPYVPVLHAPHLFNTVRWTGSANMTVMPLSRVSGRVGYWRTSAQGPSFSSNVSKSLTNPLLNQWWQYTNETWSGGIDWKVFRKTVVSYDQLFTSYQQDTTWSLNQFEYELADGTPVSQGINIFTTAANTCLIPGSSTTVVPSCNGTLGYHRTEPVRTSLPTEQFRFVSTFIPRVSMNGRFAYNSGTSTLNHYDEAYSGWSDSGINTTGRNIIQYNGVNDDSHLGTLRRINVNGDLGITVRVTPKIDVTDLADFRSFRDPGVTQPYTQTRFGTSLAYTSNAWSEALCPPPYTASTCPLHTKKTAADSSVAYRTEYFGQTATTNSIIAAYAPLNRLKFSLGYRYRDRSIIHTLQTTTTSTYTPPFANRGTCANVPLNPDGTCTVTPPSTPAIQNNEIHENGGLFALVTEPMSNLSIKLNAEAMYADEAFTQISPRQMYHEILRTIYRPRPWMSFAGAVNLWDSRDNVEYVHHIAHARDYSVGATIEPDGKWSVDVNYAYDDNQSKTDLCYYASSPLPGAGACQIPGSVAVNNQPFLGNGYYHAPTQFGSLYVALTPTPKLQFHAGYSVSASSGNSEILNERQIPGSLTSEYQMPSGDVAYQIHPGWFWKAAYNYYGYGEGSPVGPTLPRDFHGNMFTLSVRHDFAAREGK